MAQPSKKSNPKSASKSNDFRKYIVGFWTLFGLGILVIILLFLLAGWGAFGKMPKFEELENPETNLATEIFSSDGETLGKYYSENRTPIKYEDLPDHLIKALVATEDERFYDHAGIDARGTLRAAVFLGARGGASTITQQLAKQLFTEDVSQNFMSRVLQKFKEWIIAIRLEQKQAQQYELYIGDNGKGYSEAINFNNTSSLGLKLIQNLARQLNGTIERIASEQGTYYRLVFLEIIDETPMNTAKAP